MNTATTTTEKGVEEVVSMQDGTLETFVGKKQIIKAVQVNEDGSLTAVFKFRNGEVREWTIEAGDPLIAQYAAHGLAQKHGDELAAGKDVSLDDRISAFDTLLDRVLDVSKTVDQRWTAEREASAGGGAVSGISTLVRAIMELKGLTAEDVRTRLAAQAVALGITKQALVMSLRAEARIKPIVDRLEAEKVAKVKVDLTGIVDLL